VKERCAVFSLGRADPIRTLKGRASIRLYVMQCLERV